MAHDKAYLVCENKCFVEGMPKEQVVEEIENRTGYHSHVIIGKDSDGKILHRIIGRNLNFNFEPNYGYWWAYVGEVINPHFYNVRYIELHYNAIATSSSQTVRRKGKCNAEYKIVAGRGGDSHEIVVYDTTIPHDENATLVADVIIDYIENE